MNKPRALATVITDKPCFHEIAAIFAMGLFQQEALGDVIFSNPLTACVCSRKTTWRRKFVDFMNFNKRFLLNYNELDLKTSEVNLNWV